MGMFDWLRYEDALPDAFDGKRCQTKSLDCELDQYIVRNGRLFKQLLVLVDITDDIEFHGYEASQVSESSGLWNAYKMKVENGLVKEVILEEKGLFGGNNGHYFYIVEIEKLRTWVMTENTILESLGDLKNSEYDNLDNKWVLIRKVSKDSDYQSQPITIYSTYEEALQAGQDWFDEVTKGKNE